MNIYGENESNHQTKIGVSDKHNENDTFLGQLFTEMECSINLEDGIIYVFSDIDDNVQYEIMAKTKSILKYRQHSNKNIGDPINIIINSDGGNVHSAFGIIDYINTLDVPVNTISIGRAFSAGALILISGTGIRLASKNSSIMLHEISADHFGKSSDLKANTAHLNDLENNALEILKSKTNKPKEWWAEKITKDFYMTAQQAIELGVIDKII
jgi:ATP-dependent Clp protease protease subunit